MKLGNSETDELQGTASSSSRGRSSLDFQVRSGTDELMLTPKPGKRKNQRQQMQDEQQQQQYHRRTHQTRARGSSGPPKRRWDLSDLSSMSQEQLLEALYADPELAQEAAKVAERLTKEEAMPPSSAPAGARNARRQPTGGKKKSKPVKKEFNEHSDHMRDLMDGGVPFMQWMIILVVLGFVAYWVRKIIALPEKKDRTRIVTTRSRGKGTKNKKTDKKSKTTPAKKTSSVLSLEETVRAIEKNGEVEPPKKSSGASFSKKTSATKRKKKAKVNATTISRKEDESQQPSSTGQKKNDNTSTSTNESMLTMSMTAKSEDDGIGWETVSKSRTALEAEKKQSISPTYAPTNSTTTKSDAQSETQAFTATTRVAEKPEVQEQATIFATNATTKGNAVGPKKLDEVIHDPAEKEDNTPPPSNGPGSSNNNKKKKTKKKAKKSDAAAADKSATPTPRDQSSEDYINEALSPESSMENDEALAQKLQHEEETLAKAEMSEGEEIVWEEVTNRKRKGH